MNKRLRQFGLACCALAAVSVGITHSAAAQSLQVAYGNSGVQSLTYGSSVLEDVSRYPSDGFHIWHMKATDLAGNPLTSGQYGWGENNLGRTWDAQTNTWSYQFVWGSISTQVVQSGNTLNLIVTEKNDAGSGILFDGAEIYPFALHFPNDPVGFSGYTQYKITTTDPGVSIADFGAGIVTSVIPDESKSLYGGWKNVGSATYSPIMTGTAPDGLAQFLPHNDLPVQPGSSITYIVSLRFTPEGTAASAADAYGSFEATYPSQMTWTDKRIIGTAYLASSPPGNGSIHQPGGFPTNPRRYFNDSAVDVTTVIGMKSFQARVLAQAASNALNARNLNSQGVITWDLEGEQYPQETSYVCSPDQIATVSPEMESIVTDPTSSYVGLKLDDAYFKTMSDAGLKNGICLRPQVFTRNSDGTATQQFLSTDQTIIENLETKAKLANSRWGVTIFYVDSNVDVYGGVLDPAIFQQLIRDYPGFLFIPEETTARYYAYSAPFYSFIFHTTLGTSNQIYDVYPHAFGVNLVNDVSATTLAEYQPQLTMAVRHGDILMGHADYWQANDPTLVSIYRAAGVSGVAPLQVLTTIHWPSPPSIAYGTALSSKQLNASASAAGTFVYSPPAGTVLSVGSHTVLTTFVPTDSKDYKTATASVSQAVTKAAPEISWAVPASIAPGIALSPAQLNARASVPGSFTYSPAAGTLLPLGITVLKVTFQPANLVNYSSVTKIVSIAVQMDSKLAITSPSPGTTVSGILGVLGQCSLTLDASGTYLMVDGVELGTQRLTQGPFTYRFDTSIVANGTHHLQLWAHDIGNDVTLSPIVTVVVRN